MPGPPSGNVPPLHFPRPSCTSVPVLQEMLSTIELDGNGVCVCVCAARRVIACACVCELPAGRGDRGGGVIIAL